MHHPQVVQSPIVNDCLRVKIDGHTEVQVVPKLLLQGCVRELHNNLVSNADNGGLKEERDEDNNIIISDYTLRSLLPVWLKMLHICQKYTIIITVMTISLFKKTQGYQPKFSKQKVWGKKNCIYETYKNTVMPHGRHI